MWGGNKMAPNKPPIALPAEISREICAGEGGQPRPIPPLVLDLLASRVWPRGCKRCAEIMDIETKLDYEVRQIVAHLMSNVRLIREKNNRRWAKFAKICRIPVVGNLYFRAFDAPKLLEEPPYYKHPAYIAARESIEPLAWQLETLKKDDLEHWGDEKVKTDDGRIHDPDPGYTRRQCYEKGYATFLPDKYDFNSAAGSGKFEEGKMVMCCVTKQLHTITRCSILSSKKGIFYYSPGTYYQTPGYLGFAKI
jgi:hypothetical protein